MSYKLLAFSDGKTVLSHMVLKSDTNPTHTLCGEEIKRHTMVKLDATQNTCMQCFDIALGTKKKYTKNT
jgi:hypothetical protein